MTRVLGPELPGTRQVLLAFERASVREHVCGGYACQFLTEQVQRPFAPRGLLLWGATDETLVHFVRVGNTHEAEITASPIPGRFFEQGRSFEEIEALAAVGEIEAAVPTRLVLDMSEACIGVQITLAVSGPHDRACLWGLTYTAGGPFQRASVEKATTGDHYVGRLDNVRLGGLETVVDVVAPTAETAAQLVVGLSRSGRY
jgi:hypothetical protein